jgi:hypothetical protein
LSTYGNLIDGLKTLKLAQVLLPFFDTFRILYTVVVLTLAIGYPSLQIMLLFLISLARQMYLVCWRPLEEGCTLSVFNEVLVTVYLYFLFFMTDCNETNKLRDVASYGLVVVICMYSIINIVLFIKACIVTAKNKITRCWR